MNAPATISNIEKVPTAHETPQRETGMPAEATTIYRPAADIFETELAFTVILDMPGVQPEGIEVTMTGNELSITGKVPLRRPVAAAGLLHREYGVGDFARTFRLGEGIDRAAIAASYEAGVLTLTLPKSDRARARKINVTVN